MEAELISLSFYCHPDLHTSSPFHFCLLRKKLQPSSFELVKVEGKLERLFLSSSQKQAKPINDLTIKPHLAFVVVVITW